MAKTDPIEAPKEKLAKMLGNPDSKEDAPEHSISDLKVMMEADRLTHTETKALLKHITHHMDPGGALVVCYMRDDDVNDAYSAVGAVKGDPGKCALGVITLLKKILESC
jgi:hypothetical protein